MTHGYKQTEVGTIPVDWEVKSLGEIGDFAKGKGLLKEDIKAYGSTPAIPYTALYTDFSEILNYDNIKWFIDGKSQTYIVSEPCVLIASSSNMVENTGKASALTGTTPVAIGREVIILKTLSNSSYISYLLSTPLYRRKTLVLARGTTIKHVYPATFLNYKIALPRPSEQAAIATALSDVDALLDGLEQLVDKKLNIKQAVMQQLLTGQTRLPGFHDEWEVTRMSALTSIPVQNGVFYEPSRKGRGCKLINVSDLYSNVPISTQSLELFDANTNEILRFGVDHGDIFFTRSSLTLDGIAHCNIYKKCENENVVFDCHIIRIRPNTKRVDPFFLFRYCMSFDTRKYLVANAKTTTMTTVDQSVIANLPIALPSLAEQTAIATVLSDMDDELSALEARRDKTRALKQAMMQELLTGKTRLVPPSSNVAATDMP